MKAEKNRIRKNAKTMRGRLLRLNNKTPGYRVVRQKKVNLSKEK